MRNVTDVIEVLWRVMVVRGDHIIFFFYIFVR